MSVKGMLARTSAISAAGLFFMPGSASGWQGAWAGAGQAPASAPASAPAAALASAPAAALASAAAAAATLAADRPTVPSPGRSSSLQAVTCVSARDCWAVGSYETPRAELNEALHWNGSRWSRIATPDHGTGPGAHSTLAAVACSSARNCWAVGSYRSGTTALNQALHWNGTRWSRIATPDPGDAANGAHSLNGVSCVSRADCWAVGSHISDRGIGRNAALRWNGQSWSAVGTPNPGANVAGEGRRLSGVTCISAADCWAVGGYGHGTGTGRSEILRWNGTQWLKVAAGRSAAGGSGALTGVACTSAANCWTVMGQHSARGAVHWNGAGWSAVATPGGGELNGVVCASAASCMSAGNYDGPGALLNEVLRWNGASWSASPVPEPGGTGAGAQHRLAAVACSSAARCWAVGSYWDSSAAARRNVVLRWNGRTWSS